MPEVGKADKMSEICPIQRDNWLYWLKLDERPHANLHLCNEMLQK